MWDWILGSKRELIISGAVIAVSLLLTVVGRIIVGRTARDVDLRQRLRRGVTYTGTGLIALGLAVVWFQQLQQALIAATAVAVACVVASKELLICILGGVYKAFVAPYEIGDRIEVVGLRGDVIDSGLLATVVMEVGPSEQSQRSTGRVTSIPHSVLLANPVHNATRWTFGWHELTLRIAAGGPWREVEAALLELAEREHAPIQQSLEKKLRDLEGDFAFKAPPARPAVFAAIEPDGRLAITLRWAVNARQKRVSEDRIVRALVERFGADAFGPAKKPDPANP